ncbi:hypothetical protein C2S53_014036 [Perilla frutescens var. hirtella]|uniref:Uncharacterized protein n=1 Tax=Perilla frutescens var. hirtella TaxID=608512 RepID=A0AAD4NYE6_PERFH|nr:hypothetical protein C2S53_014036 [Perilla frutescens var. hirtella]
MAFVKRMIQLGGKSGICTAKPSRRLSSNWSGYRADHGHMPPNAKLHTTVVVNTLDLVRRLEAKGIPSKEIASVMSEISNGSLKTTSQNPYFIDKLQKHANVLKLNLCILSLGLTFLAFSKLFLDDKMLHIKIEKLHERMNETSKDMAKIISRQGSGLDKAEPSDDEEDISSDNVHPAFPILLMSLVATFAAIVIRYTDT